MSIFKNEAPHKFHQFAASMPDDCAECQHPRRHKIHTDEAPSDAEVQEAIESIKGATLVQIEARPIILTQAMRKAIQENAEREHFTEAYEGFNDCEFNNGGTCDCGKAEAEAAWQEILNIEKEQA